MVSNCRFQSRSSSLPCSSLSYAYSVHAQLVINQKVTSDVIRGRSSTAWPSINVLFNSGVEGPGVGGQWFLVTKRPGSGSALSRVRPPGSFQLHLKWWSGTVRWISEFWGPGSGGPGPGPTHFSWQRGRGRGSLFHICCPWGPGPGAQLLFLYRPLHPWFNCILLLLLLSCVLSLTMLTAQFCSTVSRAPWRLGAWTVIFFLPFNSWQRVSRCFRPWMWYLSFPASCSVFRTSVFLQSVLMILRKLKSNILILTMRTLGRPRTQNSAKRLFHVDLALFWRLYYYSWFLSVASGCGVRLLFHTFWYLCNLPENQPASNGSKLLVVKSVLYPASGTVKLPLVFTASLWWSRDCFASGVWDCHLSPFRRTRVPSHAPWRCQNIPCSSLGVTSPTKFSRCCAKGEYTLSSLSQSEFPFCSVTLSVNHWKVNSDHNDMAS